MTADPRVLHAILRTDLLAFAQHAFRTLEPGTAFQPNWHLEHLAHLLQSVAEGRIRRLIVNVPPRSGKSLMTSVAFPAWLLGHDPRRRVICVSYAEDLARKLSLDTRTVMQSPWFEALFPDCRLHRRPRDVELVTDQRGSRFAAGVGGAVLGRGADVIIFDDPIKALHAASQAERERVNAFYDSTLQTRLNQKRTGAIVIIMQRLHQDDLVGHVLARDPEGWTVASIPAIAPQDATYVLSAVPGHVHHRRAGEVLHPEREPRWVLDDVRRDIGPRPFSAQYQQQPIPPGGALIRSEWLRSYDRLPARFDKVVVSWDTASTLGEASDWSVGTVWGRRGPDYFLINVIRGRFEAPDLRGQIIAADYRYRADATVIEKTSHGIALSQDLRRSGHLRTVLSSPRVGKAMRFEAEAGKFEASCVHLPRDAPWLAEYLGELLGFPNAKHDDQVDSTSQALRYLTVQHKPSVARREEDYGPSGRRTRASLTRRRAPEPEPEQSHEEFTEVPPLAPRVIHMPAEYEPEAEGP